MNFLQILLHYTFMRHAALAGVLAGAACGITGTYVVIKRITFISGGIAHAVLGGMGIAYYLGINPMIGALAFALSSAILLGLVTLRARQREDTLIGALWAIGMAIGIIFISMTPGYNVDLMSFLFGNILMVSTTALWVLLAADLLIVTVTVIFYRQFLALCFDEEFARVRGLKVEWIYILLLCLIALTVVILIQVVGLILVIALLTLPAAIASLYARNLGKMMGLASFIGIVFTLLGLIVSYYLNLPSGATIIIIAGFSYLLALTLDRLALILRQRKNSTLPSER